MLDSSTKSSELTKSDETVKQSENDRKEFEEVEISSMRKA